VYWQRRSRLNAGQYTLRGTSKRATNNAGSGKLLPSVHLAHPLLGDHRIKFESGGPEWAGQRVEGTDTMSAAAVAHGALQISVGLLQLAEGRGTRAGVFGF
jgi:hypothetical protein